MSLVPVAPLVLLLPSFHPPPLPSLSLPTSIPPLYVNQFCFLLKAKVRSPVLFEFQKCPTPLRQPVLFPLRQRFVRLYFSNFRNLHSYHCRRI